MGPTPTTDASEGPYAHTPSQAEGERDEPPERGGPERHPDVPRTEPSQAEGERQD